MDKADAIADLLEVAGRLTGWADYHRMWGAHKVEPYAERDRNATQNYTHLADRIKAAVQTLEGEVTE